MKYLYPAICFFTLFATACGSSRIRKIEQGKDAATAISFTYPQPDYGSLTYWAAHPNKWDPSDSVPKPYQQAYKPDEKVDVFFVHPTTYTQNSIVENLPTNEQAWNAPLDDEALNKQTDYSTILNQASAFNVFNVYAPRYRQAHIKAFSLTDSLSKPLFDKAYSDVAAAFDYYLQHENKGKPFIIAAHSQGTVHAARLLKEKIENTPLQKQLVAAYIIGMAVPVDYFASLEPCKKPGSTGCVLGWRTFKKGYVPENVKMETGKKLVINPLTFDADEPTSKRKVSESRLISTQ